jgi:hypothetical protein
VSIIVSVVTPQFLLHVSDHTVGAPVRTLAVRAKLVNGFVSALSDRADTAGWLPSVAITPTLPPPAVAEVLRDGATRRFEKLRTDEGQGSPSTMLLSGRGHKPDMGAVAFRFTVTNFEHEADTAKIGEVELDDDGISAQFATYGGDYVHRDRTFDRPYSVVVAGAGDVADRMRERVAAVARAIKKGRSGDDVALACAAVVDRFRETAADRCGAGVLLARMLPDGSVEAAAIVGGSATAVDIPALP